MSKVIDIYEGDFYFRFILNNLEGMPLTNDISVWILALLIGLFVLIKAADYFNQSAEIIGLSFGMSPFIIGVLITAVGTSLPELVSSIIAVLRNASDIVPGIITGSNITNIFFVIGIVTLVHRKPIYLFSEFITVDLQFLIGSALFIYIAFSDFQVTLLEGILSLLGFVIYFLYLINSMRKSQPFSKEDEILQKPKLKVYLQFILAGFLVYGAAEVLIHSVVFIAEYYQIGSSVIAASIVALGTSLPELMVSLDAINKNKSDYALGNILGSSIFNSFMVMGFASLFGNIIVSEEVVSLIVPIMLVATFLLYTLTRDKVVNIWEGMLFLLFYILFISKTL